MVFTVRCHAPALRFPLVCGNLSGARRIAEPDTLVCTFGVSLSMSGGRLGIVVFWLVTISCPQRPRRAERLALKLACVDRETSGGVWFEACRRRLSCDCIRDGVSQSCYGRSD